MSAAGMDGRGPRAGESGVAQAMAARPADVAVLCTEGFVDVLPLARQNRPDPYAVHEPASPWLQWLPEAWRIPVRGRLDADGREVEPLDVDRAIDALRALPRPPAAIAIALLFSHIDPRHELQLEQALRAAFPRVRLASSHRVAPRPGEYERTLATVRSLGLAPTEGPGSHADGPGDEADDPFAATLEAIANRMQQRLVETAVSSVVREAMDCAAAIFLPDGRLVAQARTLPLLLGSLEPAVAGILEAYGVQTMRAGDVFVSNDPWAGATHLPDLVLLRPVASAGRVRALVACVLHHQDVGGISPGSVPTSATSIQQEGLRIPPIRLYDEGALDQGVLRLLTANSRMPDNLAGDLQAQWNGLELGAGELASWMDSLGDGFEAGCAAVLNAAENATRAALRAAPDGRYRFEDALDGDGLTDDPVPVVVVIDKQGDEALIDLSECAPQAHGPVNASRGAVWAAVSYFARMIGQRAPSNGGCTRPLTLRTRPGTIVDPEFPAAVNARTNLIKLLANGLLGAWAQAQPGHMPAPNAAEAVVLSLSGTDGHGRRWLFTEIIASAAGGSPWADGGSGISTDVGNARSTPAEVIEAQAPLRVERVALRRGSGGPGVHAGGDGVIRAYRLLDGSGSISYRGERHRTAPQGAAGGRAGQCACARIERADGRVDWLPAKARTEWHAGDRLVIETAGGGGWGSPLGARSTPPSP